jgi:putative oxidoreductase
MANARTFRSGMIADSTYSAMRIVVGFLFLCHGLQKLFGVLGGHQAALTSRLGAAGIIETTAGILIMLGIFTTAAAVVASAEMVAAYMLQHAPRGGLPIQNGGELAVAYCFVFLYVATQGDGRLSVAALTGRRR